MSFSIQKAVDLSSFGWDDCVIKFKSIAYSEAKELRSKFEGIDPTKADEAVERSAFDFIKSKFISGQALDDNGKKVDLTKDQIEDLPVEIVTRCINELIGGTPNPNS